MTRAGPFTQQAMERAISAALAKGLPVTGVTVHTDGSYTVNFVEQRPPASTSTLTTEPKLRDAREKFRAG